MIHHFDVYVVRCSNGCRGAAGGFVMSPDEAVDDATESGWLCVADTHLCRACKAELLTGKPLSMKQRLRLMTG